MCERERMYGWIIWQGFAEKKLVDHAPSPACTCICHLHLSSTGTQTPTPTPAWTDLHDHGNGLKVLALVGDVGLETLTVGIKIRYLSTIAQQAFR